VEVSVADNGPGIPEALPSKVLQRFFRLETSRTTPEVQESFISVGVEALGRDAGPRPAAKLLNQDSRHTAVGR
jgi:hypothetical protein